MLGRIRKFSTTIFAKIFLFIIAIPFVFWGMGGLFSEGNQNTIATISKDKISVKEFINYINLNAPPESEMNSALLEKILSKFIGEKVIEKEIKTLNIIISESYLSKLIKNEKFFKKENKFSRTEYEKFLVVNSLDAVVFENNLLKQKKKELLIDFISGGITPSHFVINSDFNILNQSRNVEVIKLNNLIKKSLNFSNNEIQSYFDKNKESYNYIFKTINFIEINPENLTGNKEFSNIFFEKIDRIDDLIIEDKNLDFLLKEFNLNSASKITFDKFGKNKNGNEINNFPAKLVKNIFSANENESTLLITLENKYYIIEITKTQSVQKQISDSFVYNDILDNLKNVAKRKYIVDLISKINKNEFNKSDFYKFSKDEGVDIEKIIIEGQTDDKILQSSVVTQIYNYPQDKVIVVADLGFSKSYLVYIKKIENVSITNNSDEYKKYLNLSKVKLMSNIYNTYDAYLRFKYKIDINYKALENLKNNI